MVAFDGSHQCQTHAGVAAGGLDDGGSGLEEPLLFGLFNHGKGDAIFHTTTGVEALDFGDDGSRKVFRG